MCLLKCLNNPQHSIDMKSAPIRSKKKTRKKTLNSNQSSINESVNSLIQEIDKLEIYRLASDPNTPADMLTQLSISNDQHCQYQIASNPNTPEILLHELWLAHPLATLENPIMAYNTFSSGKKFHELLPEKVKLMLYHSLRNDSRCEEIETLLPSCDRKNWLGYHYPKCNLPEIDEEIMTSIYKDLATDVSLKVRSGVLHRFRPEHLCFFTNDPDADIRLRVANNIPVREFDSRFDSPWEKIVNSLCVDSDHRIRKCVAGSIQLSTFAHQTLAKDSSIDVRETLASCGNGPCLTESDWLSLISNEPTLSLQIASNKACPESLRLDLTTHTEAKVRTKAWEGFNFIKSTLSVKLAEKIECLLGEPMFEEERKVVAQNTCLSSPIAERLIHCSFQVTRILAANKSLLLEQKSQLLKSEDIETAVIAMHNNKTSELLREGFHHTHPRVRAEVAGQVDPLATSLRLKLAIDPSPIVRLAVLKYIIHRVAHYDGCNICQTLVILSRDPLAKIRADVIRDRRLPDVELTRLGRDPSVRVRIEVLRRKSRNPESDYGLLDHKSELVRLIAAKLIMGRYRGDTGLYLGKLNRFDVKIAADSSAAVRMVAAKSKITNIKSLAHLIRDADPEVQHSITQRWMPRTRTDMDSWLGKPITRALATLEASSNPYCRAITTGSRIAGKRRQKRLSRDRCWYVRAMLAKNGVCLADEILQCLSEDSHPIVKKYAHDRLALKNISNKRIEV